MFVVRHEQMEILSKAMVDAFVERTVASLRKQLPVTTKGVSEADLARTIRKGIDKAAGFNITDESDVERFLMYVCRYGMNFDAAPEFEQTARMLRFRNLEGTEKVNRLMVEHPIPAEIAP